MRFWRRSCIQEVLSPVSVEQYVESWQLQSVVERQFLVIGEAIVRLRDLERPLFDSLPDPSAIVKFRNVLVHVYDQVDPARVFEIAAEELPGLIGVLDVLVLKAQREGL